MRANIVEMPVLGIRKRALPQLIGPRLYAACKMFGRMPVKIVARKHRGVHKKTDEVLRRKALFLY